MEINVFDTDKNGGFIGEIFINKESFAKILCEEGFATVHTYSAEKSGNSNELLAAEQRAKDVKKGLWVGWDPSLDTAEEDSGPNADAPAERQKDYREVVITNIDEDGKIKLQ